MSLDRERSCASIGEAITAHRAAVAALVESCAQETKLPADEWTADQEKAVEAVSEAYFAMMVTSVPTLADLAELTRYLASLVDDGVPPLSIHLTTDELCQAVLAIQDTANDLALSPSAARAPDLSALTAKELILLHEASERAADAFMDFGNQPRAAGRTIMEALDDERDRLDRRCEAIEAHMKRLDSGEDDDERLLFLARTSLVRHDLADASAFTVALAHVRGARGGPLG